MYRCQLNFAMFCATIALVISWQHPNHPNLLVCSAYRFHVYFHVRIILHHLSISLPRKDGFNKVKNSYIKDAYYSICDGGKATQRSPPDNLTRLIITQSKGFTKKGIGKLSRFVRAYVYLVLTSQVQARSSIVGNSASSVDAQEVFKSTFKALINEDYSVTTDIDRYQGVLEHALSKVDFSVGTDIYMLPSNLNLNVGKTVGYNKKILISNTDMKIGSNKNINKDHKSMTPPEPGKVEAAKTDKPIKDRLTAVSAEGQDPSESQRQME